MKRRPPKRTVKTLSVEDKMVGVMYGAVPAWEGTFEETVEKTRVKWDIFGAYSTRERYTEVNVYTSITFDPDTAEAWRKGERIPDRGPS